MFTLTLSLSVSISVCFLCLSFSLLLFHSLQLCSSSFCLTVLSSLSSLDTALLSIISSLSLRLITGPLCLSVSQNSTPNSSSLSTASWSGTVTHNPPLSLPVPPSLPSLSTYFPWSMLLFILCHSWVGGGTFGGDINRKRNAGMIEWMKMNWLHHAEIS